MNKIVNELDFDDSNIAQINLPEGLVIQTIMNNSQDTIYFKNEQSKFILNSQAHAMQFGEKKAENMIGKDDFDYFPEAFAEASYEIEKQIIKTGVPIIGHIEKWAKESGETVWFSASKYPLFDFSGAVIGTWGTSRDITALKEAERLLEETNKKLMDANKRLEVLSTRDELSGLYNHRHFFETLNVTFAQETRLREAGKSSGFSILFIDIDLFKRINDTYGHMIGDVVIRSVGNLLNESTRITDTCFRYGGDEFALILSNADLDAAHMIAAKISEQIASTQMVTEKGLINITASIGVACFSEVDSATQLVHLADERVYKSKVEGRNCNF